MKNNYKPRIVEFGIFNIDTRQGKYGLYPGDTFETISSSHMVIGSSKSLFPALCGKTGLFVMSKCSGIWEQFPEGVPAIKIIKRHGQKLIDKGEMSQAE